MSNILIIEALQKRPGGSHHRVGDGTAYHFADDGTGRHVCAIASADHAQQFLRVAEGFRLAGTTAATSIGVPPVSPAPAPQVSPAPVPAPGGVEPAATATVIEPTPAPTPAPAPATETPLALVDMSLDQLRDLFAKEVGREPNARAKAETLIAQIEATRAERA
ncbi:hypothetical protein [Frigidibacter oleivorans]|uniref:hypothetical protein n=1 Tax=Frigidibacter oleivorans TaxID=2487129 RepID=UPI000F8D9F5C|nr:hypothetical protein [Frigidibacter oleivorans]